MGKGSETRGSQIQDRRTDCGGGTAYSRPVMDGPAKARPPLGDNRDAAMTPRPRSYSLRRADRSTADRCPVRGGGGQPVRFAAENHMAAVSRARPPKMRARPSTMGQAKRNSVSMQRFTQSHATETIMKLFGGVFGINWYLSNPGEGAIDHWEGRRSEHRSPVEGTAEARFTPMGGWAGKGGLPSCACATAFSRPRSWRA